MLHSELTPSMRYVQWRHGVVECVYEASPQPSEHKVKDLMGSSVV